MTRREEIVRLAAAIVSSFDAEHDYDIKSVMTQAILLQKRLDYLQENGHLEEDMKYED